MATSYSSNGPTQTGLLGGSDPNLGKNLGLNLGSLNQNGSLGTTQNSSAGLFAGPGAKEVTSSSQSKPLSFSQGLTNTAVSTPGILQQHTPSTAVKSVSDGQNTVTFHAPDTATDTTTNKNTTDTQNAIADKKAQVDALQKYGLTDTSSLTKDATGNYVPSSGVNTNAGTGNATGTPTTTTPPSAFQTNVNKLTDISSFQNDPQYQAMLAKIQSAQNTASNTSLAGQAGPGERGAEAGVAGFEQQKNNNLLLSAQNELSNYLQGKGVEISAAQAAAGLAQPVQVSPANALVNPLTGSQVGGGALGNLPPQAQSAVSALVDNVANKNISYQDAINQLSGLGPIAQNALLPAIQTKYPGFNVNQANAQSAAQQSNIQLAGTTNAQIEKANGALDGLPAKLDALSGLQTTGSGTLTGIINSASNATGIGATATRDYQAQLDEARASVNAVLNSAISLGVVNSGVTANSLLPDNMSKQGLQTQIATVKNLMQQTKNALAKVSNASPSNTTSNSSVTGFNW